MRYVNCSPPRWRWRRSIVPTRLGRPCIGDYDPIAAPTRAAAAASRGLEERIHPLADTHPSPTADRPTLALLMTHGAAVFLIATHAAATSAITPLIAQLHFGAGDWQSFFVTVTIPLAQVTSVFWSGPLQRWPLRRYLLVFWLACMLPMGLAGLAHGYGSLLVLHIASWLGAAAWAPLNGECLKQLYRPTVRGRVFGLLLVATTASWLVTVLWFGRALQRDGEAFRWIFPLLACLQGVGLVLLAWVTRRFPVQAPAADVTPPPRSWRAALEPLRQMHRTLRDDPAFRRYEAAFLTYGGGYMICEVLFPLFVTRALHLGYRETTESAFAVRMLFMLAACVPSGWVLDRMGPVRTSGISFAILALYPLGMIFTTGWQGLAIASAFFGVGLAGVNQGWLLGPVALAPTPQRAGEYVSIHAALVGVRGVVFQGLGLGLYQLTGAFSTSFAIAMLCFLWGAVQMEQLRGFLRRRDAQSGEARRTSAACALDGSHPETQARSSHRQKPN